MYQCFGHRVKFFAVESQLDRLTIGKWQFGFGVIGERECFLYFACTHQEPPQIFLIGCGKAMRMPPMRGDGLIEIIATQRGIAIGGKHFEYAAR